MHRATLHHVSARDYLAYAGLVREARHESMRRRAERTGLPYDQVALARAAARELRGGPRSRPELFEALGLPKLRVEEPKTWIVWYLLVCDLELVHTPEASVWRNNTSGGKFVPAKEWLGSGGAHGARAAAHLVRRHLTAFGPASRADLQQWTGLTVGALAPGLERVRVRRFRDEQGRELLDLPRAPLPDADTAAPVRFLPMWDSALLAHADRSRILPEEHRKTVILRNGDVQPTFLVDGFVAGTWKHVDGRIELNPFARLPRSVRAEAENEAARLESFYAS
jgi:hypothetical protein